MRTRCGCTDPHAVAASNVRRFGPAVILENLRPIAAGDPVDWRSEGASADVRATIGRFLAESPTPEEAAALFWWARNRLVPDLGLAGDDRVALLDYADLVNQPVHTVRTLYRWVGCRYPGDRTSRDVRKSSLGEGATIQFRPEIESLCGELWDELRRSATRSGLRARAAKISERT